VLDTNVVSRVLDGDDRVLGPLAQVEPQDVGLAELPFGAENSPRRGENRKRVEATIQRFPVLGLSGDETEPLRSRSACNFSYVNAMLGAFKDFRSCHAAEARSKAGSALGARRAFGRPRLRDTC
jgi:hypothetical protein